MTYDTRLDPIYNCLSERCSIEHFAVGKRQAEIVVAWQDNTLQSSEQQRTFYVDFYDSDYTTGTILAFRDDQIETYDEDTEEYETDFMLDKNSEVNLGQFNSIEEACQLLRDYLQYPLNLNEA